MVAERDMESRAGGHEARPISRTGIVIFALEIGLIVTLAIVWFGSESLQRSHSLWVLSFYSFLSQFLIAITPHEPVFLYFSKFHTPIVVTAISIAGTILIEIVNYSLLRFVFDLNALQKVTHGRFAKKVVALFDKFPFAALLVAGLTPIPFAPFRFLVVLARYPILKYLLAVLISRSLRFYLLAVFGNMVQVPNSVVLILFIGFFVIAGIPIVKMLSRGDRNSCGSGETP
jgi:membrane protein YqaA with SNARE-associated domain